MRVAPAIVHLALHVSQQQEAVGVEALLTQLAVEGKLLTLTI